MGDFILITMAKYGNTQINRYASTDLVEQAWQFAVSRDANRKSDMPGSISNRCGGDP